MNNADRKFNEKSVILSAALLLCVFSFFATGCTDKGTIVNSEPSNISYQGTYTINDYITLGGSKAPGTPGESSTPYDLNFYYVDSSEVIGLRGGYFDAKGVRAYLKITDIGAVKYEIVDSVPEITGRDSYYENVRNTTIFSAQSNEITLLKLDHVYGIYKWTAQGGNYAKIIIDSIDVQNGWVKVRALYQVRQGYNKFY